MTPITVSVNTLLNLLVGGYLCSHLLFGLVTHYHSVFQVRAYNRNIAESHSSSSRVSSSKMLMAFAGRMTLGLPWFVTRAIVAPIGNTWHMTPEQLASI